MLDFVKSNPLLALIFGLIAGFAINSAPGALYLGELDTGVVTCDTDGELIAPSGARSMTLVGGATTVYIGGPDVDGSTAGERGLSLCTSGCDYTILPIDSGRAYCATGAGTQAIEYTFGVQ